MSCDCRYPNVLETPQGPLFPRHFAAKSPAKKPTPKTKPQPPAKKSKPPTKKPKKK